MVVLVVVLVVFKYGGRESGWNNRHRQMKRAKKGKERDSIGETELSNKIELSK